MASGSFTRLTDSGSFPAPPPETESYQRVPPPELEPPSSKVPPPETEAYRSVLPPALGLSQRAPLVPELESPSKVPPLAVLSEALFRDLTDRIAAARISDDPSSGGNAAPRATNEPGLGNSESEAVYRDADPDARNGLTAQGLAREDPTARDDGTSRERETTGAERASETSTSTITAADAAKLVPDYSLGSLRVLFQSQLDRALAILDHGGVTKLIAHPSGRCAFQVFGNPKVASYHICLPHHYCPCQSFFYDALSRGEQLMCKHLLAARLAESLQCYNVAHVNDGALCLALSQM